MRKLLLALILSIGCFGQDLPDAPLPQPPPALRTFNQHQNYTLFENVSQRNHVVIFLTLEFKEHVTDSPFRFNVHFTNAFSVGYEIHHVCGFLPPGPACRD